ncbi:hypothetical protein BDF22DRAFT_616268 [Syncephalis plumigaleata]|nr:hypothetical protein BDF22DRAFT_616268 [Syncephalis plumigaleata]
MWQAIIRFFFFFAVLHYAWSVDDYLYKDTLNKKGVEKTTLELEHATTTGTATTDAIKPTPTVVTDAVREDNLRTIAQLPGLEKLAVPNGAYLKPFLVPRPVGSNAHKEVQAYIRSTFTSLGWKVDEDRFDDKTPLGVKSFNNIIVTKFPEATRQLVLAAHYDSLYFPPPNDNKFVGATDSSVPCAMLVDIATSLNKRLDSLRGTGRGLQIIFFDGEEAFVQWGPKDSLYGSRHLAEQWSKTYHPRALASTTPPISYIESIELFVLLDLLGTKDPVLRSLQPATSTQFNRISQLERRLATLGLLGTKGQVVSGPIPKTNDAVEAAAENDYYFQPSNEFDFQSHIQDDHLPFLQRNVPIIHLIPPVFPTVWHQFTDNASALDETTIRHLTVVMRVFVADYLGLAQF